MLLTSLKGILFTFRSRYWFTIGRQLVFSLGRWSSRIQAGFHVTGPTWETSEGEIAPFAYRTVTVYGRPFQIVRLGGSFVTPRDVYSRPQKFPRPRAHNACKLDMNAVWADSRSLAAT